MFLIIDLYTHGATITRRYTIVQTKIRSKIRKIKDEFRKTIKNHRITERKTSNEKRKTNIKEDRWIDRKRYTYGIQTHVRMGVGRDAIISFTISVGTCYHEDLSVCLPLAKYLGQLSNARLAPWIYQSGRSKEGWEKRGARTPIRWERQG
jgi:hypothetical protein